MGISSLTLTLPQLQPQPPPPLYSNVPGKLVSVANAPVLNLTILISRYRCSSLTVKSNPGPRRRSPLSDFEIASTQRFSEPPAKYWCQFSVKLSRPALDIKKPCSSSPPSVITSARSCLAHQSYGGSSTCAGPLAPSFWNDANGTQFPSYPTSWRETPRAMPGYTPV